ncbi:MAG: hypothetical protein PVF74_10880 [Anaerolineales bacterium]|jgi:hypothetical protein
MPSVAYDLGYFQAGVRVLKEYILSSEIYWPAGAKPPAGEPSYPQLTLGGLLLARARLRARRLPTDRDVELTRLEREFDRLCSRWRVSWQAKAEREFHARLVLWRDFLEEYRAHPGNHVDRYAYEVSRRVMLALLTPEAPGVPPEEIELLGALDQLLETILVRGEFIWDAEIKLGFPPETYWYLYGLPRG